jgi:nitric oxide reductase NorQ protein
VSLSFDYPGPEQEAEIVFREGDVNRDMARLLVKFAIMTRSLRDSGLAEGASTRLLIQVGKLISQGIDIRIACRAAVTESLTDDPELLAAIDEMAGSLF